MASIRTEYRTGTSSDDQTFVGHAAQPSARPPPVVFSGRRRGSSVVTNRRRRRRTRGAHADRSQERPGGDVDGRRATHSRRRARPAPPTRCRPRGRICTSSPSAARSARASGVEPLGPVRAAQVVARADDGLQIAHLRTAPGTPNMAERFVRSAPCRLRGLLEEEGSPPRRRRRDAPDRAFARCAPRARHAASPADGGDAGQRHDVAGL